MFVIFGIGSLVLAARNHCAIPASR